MVDTLGFHLLGIGAFRRFARLRQPLLIGRPRGGHPSIRVIARPLNKILKSLLYSKQVQQPLVIGLLDRAVSHDGPREQSRLVHDLVARLSRPQLLEPPCPPVHPFACHRRHADVARSRHDAPECVNDRLAERPGGTEADPSS